VCIDEGSKEEAVRSGDMRGFWGVASWADVACGGCRVLELRRGFRKRNDLGGVNV